MTTEPCHVTISDGNIYSIKCNHNTSEKSVIDCCVIRHNILSTSYEWGTKCGRTVEDTLQYSRLITVDQTFKPSNTTCELKVIGHQLKFQGNSYGNISQ